VTVDHITARSPIRVHWVTPPASDIALAAALWLLDVVLFSDAVPRTYEGGSAEIGLSIAFVVYAAGGYVALAWRRLAPVVVFVIVWAHLLGAAVWFPGYRPTLGMLVALYTVAVWKGQRISTAALVVTFATMAPVAVLEELAANPNDPRGDTAALYISLLYAVVTTGVWGVGRWARTSRRRFESLDRRRKREAAEAVSAERRRIARELHDIVSHSVSVMTLQAAGARAVMPTNPERADQALAHIEAVGKESMGELRRLLGVLDDSGIVGTKIQDSVPQRGLADVPAMVDALRFSGLQVSLVVRGSSAKLAPSVDLSAYRIVQESLTNCIKHGGRNAIVTVTLAWSSQSLTVDVVDDGGTAAAKNTALSTEHGLPGLRERARAVGGHLEAGPDPSGGFRVSATLPVASDTVRDDQREDQKSPDQ